MRCLLQSEANQVRLSLTLGCLPIMDIFLRTVSYVNSRDKVFISYCQTIRCLFNFWARLTMWTWCSLECTPYHPLSWNMLVLMKINMTEAIRVSKLTAMALRTNIKVSNVQICQERELFNKYHYFINWHLFKLLHFTSKLFFSTRQCVNITQHACIHIKKEKSNA